MDDAELDRFKREISLQAYAKSLGYEVDKADSWRGAVIMRRDGDKINIGISSQTGHWIYCSYRDSLDQGTILQFALRRRGCSLGELRIELRAWIGTVGSWRPAGDDLFRLQRVQQDPEGVKSAWDAMAPVPPHPFLEKTRRIPTEVLRSPRFAGCVRRGPKGEAVFPHFDHGELCGFERRNWHQFKSFSAGGRKTLWTSNKFPHDDALVLFESGIEALSYVALFPDHDGQIRYASVGGEIGEKRQAEAIAEAILEMSDGADIVVSMNADAAGAMHTGKLRELFNRLPAGDRRFIEHYPRDFKDWNDQLKAKGSE